MKYLIEHYDCDAPRYIVMQNIATPIRHITVAIIVAYGIRVIHDLQQFPMVRVCHSLMNRQIKSKRRTGNNYL